MIDLGTLPAVIPVVLRLLAAAFVVAVSQRLWWRGRAGLSAPEQIALLSSIGLSFVVAIPLGIVWSAGIVWLIRQERAEAVPSALPWIVVTLTVLLVTPATPLLWDEFVWLTKAKFATLGLLRRLALTPGSDAIPEGYPIGFPLASAWLGREHVVLGAAALRATCIGLFLAAILRHRKQEVVWIALFVVGTPLVLLHARIAYVDLPLGFLSAALFVELRSSSPSLLRASLLAALLVGFKDEGMAHVVVIGLLSLRSSGRRAALASLVSASLFFGAWRFICWQHHIVDADHTLGRPAWSQLGEVMIMTARHACDLRSFGALWPALLTATVFAITTRRGAAEIGYLVVLLVTLHAGIILGPPRVREFALSGTLIGRLLLQLAPLAAVGIARGLSPRRLGADTPTAQDPPTLPQRSSPVRS